LFFIKACLPEKGGHAFLRFREGFPVDLKYLLWLWLALPVVIGAYPTIKGVIDIYKDLKEEDVR
jgi:hypothetical protein